LIRLFLLSVSLFITEQIFAEQIEIMESFDLGEYNVGFRYEKVLDSSRHTSLLLSQKQALVPYPYPYK
jgi:hypothetical protein